MTDAFQTLLYKCDLIRNLSRFYPLTVMEKTEEWLNTEESEDDCELAWAATFPDEISVMGAVARLEQTVQPMLQFGLVMLCSAFEDYLADAYVLYQRQRFKTEPPGELLTDEYRARVDEFGSVLETYLAQIRESFANEPSWRAKYNHISKDANQWALDSIEKESEIDEDLRAAIQDGGNTLREGSLLQIDEIMRVRSLIVHHRGKVTKKFRERFPESEFLDREGVVKASQASVESAREVVLYVAGASIDLSLGPDRRYQ